MNTEKGEVLNLRKLLTWLFLMLPFFLMSLKITQKLISDSSSSNFINNFNQFSFLAPFNESFLFTIISKTLLVFYPLFAITIYEMIPKHNNKWRSFKDTSIGKIKISKGYRFADVYYFFITLIIKQFPFIYVFLSFGLIHFNSGIKNWFSNFYENLLPLDVNFITSTTIFLITLLLTDFVKYLNHRFYHSNKFMWDLHEFHHSATEMTIISRDRDVPLQKAILGSFLLPLTLLNVLLVYEFSSRGYSLPLYIFIFDGMMQLFLGHLAHSSTKIIFPKFISFFYMSPSLHWLHHSSNPEHYDCNFGQKYPFWDKLFGTYLDESHIKDIKDFGVENTQYNKFHPLYVYLVLPFKKIAKNSKKIFV